MPAGVSGAPLERPPCPGEQRVELGADGGVVGHDQLRREARRAGADVGHEIDQRHVLLVADRRHDRRRGTR